MTLKEKLAGGQKVAGCMLRIVHNPAIVLIAKRAGLDFLIIDCEHGSYNLETIHNIALMANAVGISILARVPHLRPEHIANMLEAGVEGIQMPMIETAEQAREFVRYMKYSPLGDRGFSAFTANTGYAGVNTAEQIQRENNKTLCIAQIESKLGVENARQIAAVEGIDVLLIGPNDLSISLGIPGQTTNPIELEAITHVADACDATHKLFALHSPPAMCDRFVDRLSMNIMQFDTDFLFEGFQIVRKYADEKLSEHPGVSLSTTPSV